MTHEELILKAKEAKSAEELLALAKENGMELTEENAKTYYEQLHKTGEFSDDELDNVSGGGCHAEGGRLVVTAISRCPLWTCKSCHRGCYNDYDRHYCIEGDPPQRTGISHEVRCSTCKDMSYEGGLWLCNHKENRK